MGRKRTKPTIRVKKTKKGIEIWTTYYDGFGKVLKKDLEKLMR